MKLVKSSLVKCDGVLEGDLDKSYLSSLSGVGHNEVVAMYSALAEETTEENGYTTYELSITFKMCEKAYLLFIYDIKKKAKTIGISEEELDRIHYEASNRVVKSPNQLMIIDRLITEFPEILAETCHYVGRIKLWKTVHLGIPKLVVDNESFDRKFSSIAEIEELLASPEYHPLKIIKKYCPQ